MLNENWVFALNEDEIVDGDKKPLLVNDEKIALIKKGNEIYAITYVINASVFLLYVFRLVIRINRKVILR